MSIELKNMLAIVIPFYKLTYFEQTLDSLSIQTDKRFKVYIGNDASPEDPNELLEKFHGKFDFSYHKFDYNLGGKSLVKQWERCIDLTNKEEWIMILGDDDLLTSNVVESFYKNYSLFYNKSNLIRFASKKIIQKTKVISDVYTHPRWEKATDSFYRKFEGVTRSSLSEYIFSRETYLNHRFYDYPLAWSSDDRAWLDFSDGKPIFTINESIVIFRSSSLNISGSNDNYLEKNLSENEFFKFIILTKLNAYNNDQKLRILRRYQSGLRKYNNFNSTDFFVLLYFYLKYLNLKWIKKFFKKIIKKIFN